jgi:hypothetical protein
MTFPKLQEASKTACLISPTMGQSSGLRLPRHSAGLARARSPSPRTRASIAWASRRTGSPGSAPPSRGQRDALAAGGPWAEPGHGGGV